MWSYTWRKVFFPGYLLQHYTFLKSHHYLTLAHRRGAVTFPLRLRLDRRAAELKILCRMCRVAFVKNWNYRELRERIADGYTLRQFADLYRRPVPKHDAFNRAFNHASKKYVKAVCIPQTRWTPEGRLLARIRPAIDLLVSRRSYSQVVAGELIRSGARKRVATLVLLPNARQAI
jgi:hypothetical protein